MKILALETSAKAVSAALAENGRILAYGYQDTGLTHSRTLMPIVEHILKNTDLTMRDVDAVATAVGPGSFTGIRIGVSAAKGLAVGADKPAIAVSTLSAMARNLTLWEGLIVCAMDARRSQIYNALFRCEGGVLTRLTPDRAVGLEDLSQELRQERSPIAVVGDGGAMTAEFLCRADIPCRLAPPQLVMQSAASVALEAEALAQAGHLLRPQELLPVYLRPPQAERLRRQS
ncbi:MAG: tRNA (adenosine(37)-N6)-threonylcarbamoyltransferase complex dimerization subunit type 1 TsaB [Oscillibacter sp.]|nr:tRNA (adenosine(37)-N6)-threonylcarbamoyltransferase complex dimerization subunit type 1 TsaB [Oscillibacter sp.]